MKKGHLSKNEILLQIAKEHLFLEVLDTRNAGYLDFKEQAVWSIKAALETAYEAGKNNNN